MFIEAVLVFLKAKNIKSLIVKPLPDFYNVQTPKPANLWQAQDNSSVIKQNMILAIDYNSDYKIHKTKLKRYRKLEINGFEIREGKREFKEFWNTILVKSFTRKA